MRRGVSVVLVAGAAGVVPAALAAATVPPPPGGDGAGTGAQVAREQAEAAAAEHFATAVQGGATHIACETPSADTPGVTFFCFGVNRAGAPVVAQATINDYGSPELSAVRTGRPATTTTTSPVIGTVEGTGSQVVQVDPIAGPTIVSATHDGVGAFSVQPQQGGVPAGPPLMSVTGAWSGRYLIGLGAAISGFRVTADGNWSLSIEQRSTALAFDRETGVSGENADVIAYPQASGWTATVAYEGSGPIVVRASTVSGARELVNEPGAFTGDVEVPAGPGFMTVDAVGPWSIRPPASPATSSTSTT